MGRLKGQNGYICRNTITFFQMKKLIPSLVLLLILVIPSMVFAQGDPCTSPDIECPIDGGLSLLIAAGIGLGAKKAYDRRKAVK